MSYAIDPELAEFAEAVSGMTGSVAAMRKSSAMSAHFTRPPDLDGVTVEDRLVPSVGDAPEVPVRLYLPHQRRSTALIYDIHGGGFVSGDLALNHPANVCLARDLGVVVMSVNYRLAPETPFPGPLHDVYGGLSWAAEHATELGTSPEHVIIHGSSAGAGLAAALTHLARDRGSPHIAFQFLLTPELDDRLHTPSMQTYIDTPIWNRSIAIMSWEAYLGPDIRGTDAVSPYAAPARATDFSGLPPAYISVAEFDPLRDEAIAYAHALLHAGVGCELHLFPGTFHGSAAVKTAAITQRAHHELLDVMRTIIARMR
jgi:acetyl esterase/lipase